MIENEVLTRWQDRQHYPAPIPTDGCRNVHRYQSDQSVPCTWPGHTPEETHHHAGIVLAQGGNVNGGRRMAAQVKILILRRNAAFSTESFTAKS